ncbi:MAG: homocitrate synthase [Candidatus Anoxymicrobium japonicum]|uniref:Homocitrate synthase n=1 Tax=Candidatus Anoxymicrobium japonicum TaxID=2013648 RepID=A0A2N3G612_9ACTN|nr:MAG: homocitrate synthase [Candidatus Anoxymicrobium japonicum]
MSENTIYFIDVTNRDGVQTAQLGLAKIEKTIINMYLDQMGVFQSEAGFPTTNHETNYLRGNLALVEEGVLKRLRISGWLRAVKADIELAREMVPELKHINISISTSPQMINGKWHGTRTFDDVCESMREALERAHELDFKTVAVNAEDASRTSMADLIKFAQVARDGGAARVRYCDTLGYDDPFTIYDRIKELAEAVRLDIELHCHNDLGMAVACSVAGARGAIDGGVDAYVNTTVNGIGERAGNADLVSCLLAFMKSSGLEGRYRLDPNIDISHSWRLAKYASYAFGVPIPINQVGVGGNAFAHESGIHADGALKDRRNYELYDCEELGRGEPELVETGRMITTGAYGGVKGFRNVYEHLKIEFGSDEEAREILDLVRLANVTTGKPLTKDELMFVAEHPEEARTILTLSLYQEPKLKEKRTRVTRKVGFPQA